MKYEINTTVVVTPKSDDVFSHEFRGTIIGKTDTNSYLVRDQDDDIFDVEEDQIAED